MMLSSLKDRRRDVARRRIQAEKGQRDEERFRVDVLERNIRAEIQRERAIRGEASWSRESPPRK